MVPADLPLAACERALSPKEPVQLPHRHFDAYTVHFEESSGAALSWLHTHLAPGAGLNRLVKRRRLRLLPAPPSRRAKATPHSSRSTSGTY